MNTVFYQNHISEEALVNPADFIQPVDGFPEVCISTFSKPIIDKFAALEQTRVIANLYTANGVTPVYQMSYGGKEFAFYLSLVGAPACVSQFEEVIAMGAKKFVFFGCCGVLNDNKVQQRLIIPTAAVRDEGTSYHYAAPGEEIEPSFKSTAVLEKCFNQCGYPYALGKIWTNDAIYRETQTMIAMRKKAGCIGVDMECSALLAAAKYRNVQLLQFFYGADSLDNETWQPRDLMDYGFSNAEKYFTLALECGLQIYGY